MMRTGGILTGYLPTVLKVHKLTMALTKDPRWRLVETVEVLERSWHVTDLSVRPDHRMVGHTGFITTARRCDPAGIEEDETAAGIEEDDAAADSEDEGDPAD